MPVNKDEGILVGRPPFSKSIYEYIVIPKKDDIDTLETSLPKEILSQMYTVNTRGVARFLTGLYKVEYRRQDVPSATARGWLHRAILSATNVYKPIHIDIDSPLESVKPVDDEAQYFEYEETPVVDPDFLLMISKSTGAAANMPKRFLATPIAFRVVDDGDKKVPVLVNIMEGYLYIQENPDQLRGVLILPNYKFAILVAGEITRDELKTEILNRINASIQAFHGDYNRAGLVATEVGGEED